MLSFSLPIKLRHFGEADAISLACRGFFLPFLEKNIFARVVQPRRSIMGLHSEVIVVV